MQLMPTFGVRNDYNDGDVIFSSLCTILYQVSDKQEMSMKVKFYVPPYVCKCYDLCFTFCFVCGNNFELLDRFLALRSFCCPTMGQRWGFSLFLLKG